MLDVRPLTPDFAPQKYIVDLWDSTAKRFVNSRARILMCREMRRNSDLVKVDSKWTAQFGKEAAEWLAHAMPERQTIGLNLVNSLGENEPTYTKHPNGTTDTAIRLADQAEVWINGVRTQLVNWDQILGMTADNGEFGAAVLPSPACWDGTPTYYDTVSSTHGAQAVISKPSGKYDRDERGRIPGEPRYRGRDTSKSRQAHQEAMTDYRAQRLPFTVRLFSPLDCVPILARGTGRRPFECRGLVTRTLYDQEELIRIGFQWNRMGDKALIPRGYESGNPAGRDNQLYLYEAYLTHYDQQTREEIPFVAYTVAGQYTEQYDPQSQSHEAAIVNLRERYGMRKLMVNYFWGLHTSDEDPDWMGVPLLWPIAPSIANFESMMSAHLAHTWEEAFGGHTLEIDPDINPQAYMENNQLRQFEKPRTGEVSSYPGKVVPFTQATVSQDARYMLASLKAAILENDPSQGVDGDPSPNASGHSKLVSYDLLKSAKRQTLEGSRECVEWIGSSVFELATDLAEGKWEGVGPKGANCPVYTDIEHSLDDGTIKIRREAIEFNPRWTGDNFTVTARFKKLGNLAEVEQAASLAERGFGTFEEVREAKGDPSPETTRIKIARDRYLASDAALMEIQLGVAKLRGDVQKAQQLEAMLKGEMTPDGLPTAALAPEFQGQGSPTGPGPGGTGSPTQLPDMAQNARAGIISGQMGTASAQAAAQTINQNGGPRP